MDNKGDSDFRFCPQYCIALGPSDSKGGDEKIVSLADFVREVLPIVTYLGPHLSIDPVLMMKLIRLCAAAYAKVRKLGRLGLGFD